MRGGIEDPVLDGSRERCSGSGRQMKVEEVQWGLRGYLQTVDLRKRVLRAPLGIEWTEEEKGW